MNGPGKIIIGIHGVGDQSDGTTIQAIHRRFARQHNVPPALTLGSLRSARDGAGVYCWPMPGTDSTLGFAEVHWADIPRGCANDGYTLEETTNWTKALVERLATCQAGQGFSLADRKISVRVLREMIESIGVLKRLFYLTEKAGIFSFDLDRILNQYVNDVQVVTEYEAQRQAIVGRFHTLLAKVHHRYPAAEIHIIAHSEGTVVSLLALLEAMTEDPDAAPWIRRVKSFVTLGSPIDKHFFLWPELWAAFTGPHAHLPEQKIIWKNYYDQGDPIGCKLETFRAELEKRNYPFSNAPDLDEIGFSRYPLPGKAHLDYWEDDDLFAHIIAEAVQADTGAKAPKPDDKRVAQVIGYGMPYLAALLSLFGGLYLLYSAVVKSLAQTTSVQEIAYNVAILTCLLAGATVMARIPRLTHQRRWHLFGLVVYLLAIGLFYFCFDQDVANGLVRPLSSRLEGLEKEFLAILFVLLSAVSISFGLLWSQWSIRSFLIPGGLFIGFLVGMRVIFNDHHGPVMPVILAGGICLYLWWLAAIIFDLAFIWHRYIRHDQGREALKRYCRGGRNV
jgi:hypothetical protein